MMDITGYWPDWVTTTLKITAGVAVVAAGVALTAITFGGAAPLSVVITAATIGTIGGAATNAAIQYSELGAWENFDVDECIMAGVSGGLSATLATTPIGKRGQIIGNAFISGTNSIANGNSLGDVILDAGIGALAGWAGGPGTGRGGLVFSETLRRKQLLKSFAKSYIKSSIVGNTRSIFDKVRDNVTRLIKLTK